MVKIENYRIILTADGTGVVPQIRVDDRAVAMPACLAASHTLDALVVRRSSLRQRGQIQSLETKEASPTKLARCAPAVAVGAHNIAFGDLLENRGPGSIAPREQAHVGCLVIRVAVIEFEDRKIAGAAVNALR